MPKSAMIRARIEPELKEKVEKLFTQLGLNSTEAINLFYHQVALQKGLPFEIILPDPVHPSGLAAQARQTLVKKTRAMSPEQRLESFYQHSSLMKELAGSK